MSVKKELPKHEQEHYRRWMGMIQRCYNPNNRSYNERRSKNIMVDNVWGPENPNGLFNYAKWVNEQLVKHPEMVKTGHFRISRIKADQNYGPNNCHLVTHIDITRTRITSVLCVDKVVEMRRYKKAHPTCTLAEMEELFGFSQANISRSLRGLSWSNADKEEAPIAKFETPAVNKRLRKAQPTPLYKRIRETT